MLSPSYPSIVLFVSAKGFLIYLIVLHMEAITILIIRLSLCCTDAFLLYPFPDEKTRTRQSTQKMSAPRAENGMLYLFICSKSCPVIHSGVVTARSQLFITNELLGYFLNRITE